MAQKNGVREWGKYGIRCIYNRKNVCSYLHATFVPNDGKVEAFVNEINKKFDILENKLKKEQEKHKFWNREENRQQVWGVGKSSSSS